MLLVVRIGADDPKCVECLFAWRGDMTIDQGNHGQAAESKSSAPLRRYNRVLVDPDDSWITE